MELSRSSTQQENEDVQGRHPTEVVVWSGDVDGVHEAGTQTQSPPPHLSSSKPTAAPPPKPNERHANLNCRRHRHNAKVQLPSTCPQCRRTFRMPVRLVGHPRTNCSTQTPPTVVSPSTSPTSPTPSTNVDRLPEPLLPSHSPCPSSSSSPCSFSSFTTPQRLPL
ncbi:hypothetical protein SprV_0100202100 [Sparganum proliferum]